MASFSATNTTQRFNETTKYDVQVTGYNSTLPVFLVYKFPGVVFGLGVVFNIILLYYLLASKKYKIPLFALLTSLAVADLSACVGAGGLVLQYDPYVQFKSPFLCKMVIYTSGIGVTGSVHHLTLFAALRFYQICYPLKAHVRLTFRFMFTFCFGLWVVVLAGWIPMCYYMSAHILPSGKFACTFSGNGIATSYALLFVNTIYPTIAIPLLYIMKQIRFMQASRSVEVQRERKSTDVRAMAIVIIVFFLTWLPNNIYRFFVKPGDTDRGYYEQMMRLFSYLMHSNSAINPLIYCFAAETVRKDIIRFLCRCQ